MCYHPRLQVPACPCHTYSPIPCLSELHRIPGMSVVMSHQTSAFSCCKPLVFAIEAAHMIP